MTQAAKLRMAFMWFGVSAVIFMAGYAQGTHDMWMAVKDLLK